MEDNPMWTSFLLRWLGSITINISSSFFLNCSKNISIIHSAYNWLSPHYNTHFVLNIVLSHSM